MAKRRVRWSADAEQDLDDIVGFIVHDNPANALRIFDRLHARARMLEVNPQRGRLIPEMGASANLPLRELIEGPWRIMYAVGDAVVLVIAVVDGRRSAEAILFQRFDPDSALSS